MKSNLDQAEKRARRLATSSPKRNTNKPVKAPKPLAPKHHPRNRHQGRYDFAVLIQTHPPLQQFCIESPFKPGDLTINFADAMAVKALNTALLKHYYELENWDIPDGYLSPPIPGRADYIHHMADLLGTNHGGKILRGDDICVLDVGVGANCIYPIIGINEYSWRFIGSDIDAVALKNAQQIIDANPSLQDNLLLRHQSHPTHILNGVLHIADGVKIVICNPPFFGSLKEATAANARKKHNLKLPAQQLAGREHELWCEGGEAAFITRMVEESATQQQSSFWFSALVSDEESLKPIYAALRGVNCPIVKTIDMAQGSKKSRIVAWRFLKPKVVAAL